MKYLVFIVMSFLLVACNSNTAGFSDATPNGRYVKQGGTTTLVFGEGGKFRYESKAIGNYDGTFVMKDGVAKWEAKEVGSLSFKKNEDGTWVIPETREAYVKQ